MTIKTLDDVFEGPGITPIIEVMSGSSAASVLQDSITLDSSIYFGEYKPSELKDAKAPVFGKPEELDYDAANEICNPGCAYNPVGSTGMYNPLPGQYFENDKTLTTETRVRKYFETDGKNLVDYLTDKGEKAYDSVGVSNNYIDSDAVAGVAYKDDKAVIVAGTGFNNKLDKMVEQYKAKGLDVDRDLMERYVWDHETRHVFQYGKDMNELQAEYDVENTLKEFYSHMAGKADCLENKAKYQTLAAIASDRAASVESNYSAAA